MLLLLRLLLPALLLSCCCRCCENDTRPTVHILCLLCNATLFPYDAEFIAFSSAIINARSDMFPRFCLQPEFQVAELDKTGSAVKTFIDGYVSSSSNKALAIGAPYSQQAESVSEVAKYYYLPLIGYSNTSPTLSDKEKYPFYIRLAMTNAVYVPIVVQLLQQYKWQQFGLLTTDYEVLYPVTDMLEEELKRKNFTKYVKAIYGIDATEAIQRLANAGIRIFVVVRGFNREPLDKRIDCLIHKFGLYGKKYQWIQLGFPTTLQMGDEFGCTDEDRKISMEGSIEFESQVNDPTVVAPPDIMGRMLNETFPKFLEEYGPQVPGAAATGLYGFALRYDSFMAAALALNNTLETENYTETPQMGNSDFKRKLFRSIQLLDFAGQSGRVKLDAKGDRSSVLFVYQIRGLTRDLVGTYDPYTDRITWLKELWFRDGVSPVDVPRHIRRIVRVGGGSAAVVASLSCAGICVTLVAMAVNLRHRQLPIIKLSSPYVNSVIGAGCILVFLSCITLTVNAHLLTEVSLCWTELAMLSVGYSCAFGAMLAKTWRVHRIFTNKKLRKLAIKDSHLFAVVAAVVGVDVLLLAVWAAVDPLQLQMHSLGQQELLDDGVVILRQLAVCQSVHSNVWIGVLIGMKAVFLLFAVFFAWETRSVQLQALNDSKTMGMCVYNTTVMGVIGVMLHFALPLASVDLRFLLLGCCVVVCSATTVALVFAPKMLALLQKRSAVESVQQNSSSVAVSDN